MPYRGLQLPQQSSTARWDGKRWVLVWKLHSLFRKWNTNLSQICQEKMCNDCGWFYVTRWYLCWQSMLHIEPSTTLVSRGQTLFRTEGKGLGHGHRAVCHPTPCSVYQSQCSIQSHDTWSMWLMGRLKISVWVELFDSTSGSSTCFELVFAALSFFSNREETIAGSALLRSTRTALFSWTCQVIFTKPHPP